MTYGLEVSKVNSKIITKGTKNISADMNMNGQKLEEVTSFRNSGATLCKDGTCSAEICMTAARKHIFRAPWTDNI